MKLSLFKEILATASALQFRFPDGALVPAHFHLTEAGLLSRSFIDCGGTRRTEEKISFQLWHDVADTVHRLLPGKLLQIAALAEKTLQLPDAELEVEYQGPDTIGKWSLAYDNESFRLVPLQTACLAQEQCGLPAAESPENFTASQTPAACSPNGACC